MEECRRSFVFHENSSTPLSLNHQQLRSQISTDEFLGI